MARAAAWHIVLLGFLLACGGGSDGATRFGQVSIWRDSGPGTPFLGTAVFADGPLPPELVEMPTWTPTLSATDGPCTIYVGTTTDPKLTKLNAGTVTVSGSPSGVMVPIGSAVGTNIGLLEGDTVTVSGTAGTDVPTFSVSEPLPNSVSVTSPTFDSGYTIVRSADLAVTCSTASAGRLFVELVQQNPDVAIMCMFPASASTGTVPATTLARLSADAGGKTAAYYGVEATTMSQAGDVDIALNISDYLRTSVFVQ